MRVLRVALEVPVAKLFDYLCDADTLADVGDRVAVPFGPRERVGVVVEAVNGSAVAGARLKSVARVLAGAPRLAGHWLGPKRFFAGFYPRPVGRTRAAALAARPAPAH